MCVFSFLDSSPEGLNTSPIKLISRQKRKLNQTEKLCGRDICRTSRNLSRKAQAASRRYRVVWCCQYIHSLFAVYSHSIHSIFVVFSQSIHTLFTLYLQNVHSLFGRRTPSVRTKIWQKKRYSTPILVARR